MTRRARLAALAALLAAATPAGSQPPAPPALPASEVQAAAARPSGFDLEGHRGARGLAPENTLAAFARALEVGVTTLELDVGVTRDGAVVVSHDSRLNPDLTRGPDGRWLEGEGPALFSLDLAELRRYDVGRARPGGEAASHFPEQRPADGARVPTLTEVLALAGERAPEVRFNVETKLDPRHPDETPEPGAFAALVVAVLRAAGAVEHSALQSFDWRTLAEARRIAPELERVCLTAGAPDGGTLQAGRPGPSPWLGGLDLDDYDGSVPRLVQAASCAVWSPPHQELTAEVVEEAHGLGLRVVTWTVNDPERMDELVGLGVDGIITDRPDRLRTVLAARGAALPPSR